MADWLSHLMVQRGIIEESQRDIYSFGIQNGFLILLNLFTAFLIGLLTQKLPVVAVFSISFMTLRSFAGGYHSESKVVCYICSSVVLVIPIYTGRLFQIVPITVSCSVLFAVCAVILFLSPMDSRRRTLDHAEKIHFRKRVRIILLLQLFVLRMLLKFECMELAYAVYSSLVLIALFMLLGTVTLKLQMNRKE